MHLPGLRIAVRWRALRVLQHSVDLCRSKRLGEKLPARLPPANQVVK
jgi:hypothetical protein